MQNQPVTVTTVLTTGKNKYKPTDNCSTPQVNLLLQDCADLISADYKDWYAGVFYKLSPMVVQSLASQARSDGKSPARLFSYLLKINVG